MKAQIDLTDSLLTRVLDGTATFDIPQDTAGAGSLKDSVLKFFGAGAKKDEGATPVLRAR